ncbi:response regulator transcription factor [Parasphingopyxis algicola]|uniref:LytR/AlgR family response regulator transcription factor n=1 Tax=Parasphingopyxis algicola TaxID=2026624 RepID=UPI0015A47355|nr:LytTR family DNA-binding domain-containing protein [Parasphingopyxis algicola]QLC25196.1 response regulator transcription factor [Parasphingopyxis algicola]
MPAIPSLILEDEPLAAGALKSMLTELAGDWLNIAGIAGSANDAFAMIERERPRLIFVDIRLPGMSGLDFVRQIDPRIGVVFTTAHDEHAIAAFELGAIDYVLKPIEPERLEITLGRIAEGCEMASAGEASKRIAAVADDQQALETFYVRTGQRIIPVSITEVMRIAARDGYACLQTGDGREHCLDISLSYLASRLEPAGFLKLNRACLGNPVHIVRFERHPDKRLRTVFTDQKVVIASRSASRKLRTRVRGQFG